MPTKAKPTTPEELLTDGLLIVPPVADAARKTVEANASARAARESVAAANAALDAADAVDEAAEREAAARNESPPAPTKHQRKLDLDAAQRRLRGAKANALDAGFDYSAVLVEHREQIDAEFIASLVESARATTLARIDQNTLSNLAAILGIRRGLYSATTSRELTQSQVESPRFRTRSLLAGLQSDPQPGPRRAAGPPRRDRAGDRQADAASRSTDRETEPPGAQGQSEGDGRGMTRRVRNWWQRHLRGFSKRLRGYDRGVERSRALSLRDGLRLETFNPGDASDGVSLSEPGKTVPRDAYESGDFDSPTRREGLA